MGTADALVETADGASQWQRVGRAFTGAAVVLVIWIGFAAWCALGSAPRPRLFWVIAVAATAASVLGCLELRRRHWSIPAVRRWPLTSTGISLSICLTIFLLVHPGGGLGTLFLVACVLLGAVGLLLVALASLLFSSHRVDATLGILSVGGLAFVLVAGWSPLPYAGFRVRLALMENEYRAEAEQLMAQPPTTHEGPVDGHVVYREVSGSRAMVAWRWYDGIPARVWGVLYDPHGLHYDYGRFTSEAGSLWMVHSCTPVHGPWHSCRLY